VSHSEERDSCDDSKEQYVCTTVIKREKEIDCVQLIPIRLGPFIIVCE
jgi:hypothetical protein